MNTDKTIEVEFGLSVLIRVHLWPISLSLNRDLFGDLDAVGVQADDFARMVGQQADGVEAQIRENLRAQSAFMLGLLLAVGCAVSRVVSKSRAALMQVDQHARALL